MIYEIFDKQNNKYYIGQHNKVNLKSALEFQRASTSKPLWSYTPSASLRAVFYVSVMAFTVSIIYCIKPVVPRIVARSFTLAAVGFVPS